METVKLNDKVFERISDFKKANPGCKSFNDALETMFIERENEIKTLKADNERWQNGIHAKNHELEAAKKRIEELEAEAAENGESGAQIAELQEKLDKITAERDSIKETSDKLIAEHEENLKKLADAEQRANENGENSTAITLENERLKEENEVLKSNLAAYESTKENATGGIVLQEATKKILERVAVKLSERYGKAIDVNQIVNMCILRYNIERYTAWFHPFVIDDADIEELTGKTRRDWMKFFNTNE
jgi:chromosome segregation ATPase